MNEELLCEVKRDFERSFPDFRFSWLHEREFRGDLEVDALILETFFVPSGKKLDFAREARSLRRASETKIGRKIILVSHTFEATLEYYLKLFFRHPPIPLGLARIVKTNASEASGGEGFALELSIPLEMKHSALIAVGSLRRAWPGTEAMDGESGKEYKIQEGSLIPEQIRDLIVLPGYEDESESGATGPGFDKLHAGLRIRFLPGKVILSGGAYPKRMTDFILHLLAALHCNAFLTPAKLEGKAA
jgi:hypothetical protein